MCFAPQPSRTQYFCFTPLIITQAVAPAVDAVTEVTDRAGPNSPSLNNANTNEPNMKRLGTTLATKKVCISTHLEMQLSYHYNAKGEKLTYFFLNRILRYRVLLGKHNQNNITRTAYNKYFSND